AAADGNPLFVEEMLAMLAEDGGGRGDVVVPPTIQALLAARLDQLDAAELAVLERGSIAGQEFVRAAVVELADGVSVDGPLRELVRKDLVRAEAALGNGEVFRFRHLLIRDAAYASMPKTLRAELHERFARFLEQGSGGHVRTYEELIGYHLE